MLVSPNDPEAMLRHTYECRAAGIPFAADPSQQLAGLDGEQVRDLVDGARWLFTNEYEAALLLERTGWQRQDVLRRVGTWVTTLGADGVRIDRDGAQPCRVPAVPAGTTADPTGAGDAFRAGFLAATSHGLESGGRCTAGLRAGHRGAAHDGPAGVRRTSRRPARGPHHGLRARPPHGCSPRGWESRR